MPPLFRSRYDKYMRRILSFACLLLTALATVAQNGPRIDQLYLETRLAWQGESLSSNWQKDQCGFRGQYLNLRFDGQIVEGLTFSYRQRLNKPHGQTFFDATDWLHLDWKINEHWGLGGGKQVVLIGGYEYDRAPIDLYYNSEFWYNIACYQLGLSTWYKPTASDKLTLQVGNSPMRQWAGNNTYAVNAFWQGRHGCWEPLWSFNAMQSGGGHWMNYIALGNKFHLGQKAWLELDVMNRTDFGNYGLMNDWSVMGELSWKPTAGTRVFGKYTFDQNRNHSADDQLVMAGTQMNLLTAGVEYHPLHKWHDHLRLFAAGGWSWGRNPNPEGTLQNHLLRLEAGVKFRLDVLEGLNQMINRK